MEYHCCIFAGYVVEKCEDGKDFWEKVPGVVNGTSHPVKGLKEGKKYKFRVKAENKFGAGKPLETEKATLAKNPFGKNSVFQKIFLVYIQ
jgi:hypothetical protein